MFSGGEKAAHDQVYTGGQNARLGQRLQRIITSDKHKRQKKKRKLEEETDKKRGIAKRNAKNGKKKTPRKGKKKALPRNPRRQKARFAEMFLLPFEVLSEIADYLSILDLLSLSRVTRGLHYTMLSRNFRRIWRRAYVESGAPDFPSDMNEPQVASLVFDTFCQGCGSPHTLKVDYALRLRLCSGCAALNLIQGRKLVEGSPDVPKDDPTIFVLCVHEGASQPYSYGHGAPAAQFAESMFFAPDFQDVVREYCTYPPNSEERKQFVQHRNEVVDNLCTFAREVRSWIRGPYTSPKDNLRYHLREASISRMLVDLGYTTAEMRHDYESRTWLRLIRQPREVTYRIRRDILPRLERILKERREQIGWRRRASLRNQILPFFEKFRDEWANQNGEKPLLNFADLTEWREVKSFVMSKEPEARISEEEWKSTVEPLLPDKIIDFEKQFRFDMAVALIKARQFEGLRRLFVSQPGGITDLEVVDHAASFISPWKGPYHIQPFSTYAEVAPSQRKISSPAYKRLILYSDVIEIAAFLLHSLGFHERTTMAEMQELGEVFVCRCCDRRPARMMQWKELVRHFKTEKSLFYRLARLLRNSRGVNMVLIDSHNIDVSMQLAKRVSPGPNEGQVASSTVPGWSASRKCPICVTAFPEEHFFSEHRDDIDAHLRSTHGIEDVEKYRS